MLCPAAVSAAAVCVLLALLGPGLSLADEDSSELSLCSGCFYRRTPPQGESAELHSLCHSLPGGQTFASLSKPTCDTAVYTAFHLSSAGTEEGGEHVVTEEDNKKVVVPGLLRGGEGTSVSLTDSPLHLWDATVTTLLQSTITPKCSSSGGELYILTGVGGLGTAKDGDEECQTKPLWSAVCCSVPEGKRGFSFGLITETGEGKRQVSVKELQEILGVAELFAEGCGGAAGEVVDIREGLLSEGLPGNIETLDADLTEEHKGDKESDPNAAGGSTEGEEVVSRANKRVESDSGVNKGQEVGSEGSVEEQRDVTHSRSVRSESPESPVDYGTVEEQDTDTNSSSMVVYVLSTTLSILKAPLRPLFSRVTDFPGQVIYVFQEEFGVLSALPGETYSFFHLLTSDFLSWMGSAGETVIDIGENCFSNTYYVSSSLLGALVDSCYTGVTGVGTLAGDTVGICGDAVDNTWWVTKFFGGRLWEQSEGYVVTVVSEIWGQGKALGGGFGRLVWRSGRGVFDVFRLGGGLVMGVVDILIDAMRMASGKE
ncbi:hypothetical protein PBY51_017267 [Eleginops maclovinus]|uniref:INO80 complex subunit E n=1 Tax=Eleginops maclovinus TaxID=56733 RepID=A0AAN8ANS8_ELEMC|nr:hypothetical protein PBY51_017267 [Eleginops maclovinus]